MTMTTSAFRRFWQAAVLVAGLVTNAWAAPSAGFESGSATLSLYDVTFSALASDGSFIPMPPPIVQLQVARNTLDLQRELKQHEGEPMELSSSSRLANGEGSSVFVYDMVTANLSAAISSASIPSMFASAGFQTVGFYWMQPDTGIYLSGRIAGEVTRSSSQPIVGNSHPAYLTFSAGLYPVPAGIHEQFFFEVRRSNGEYSFDEPFSVIMFNRSDDPLLVSVNLSGGVFASALPQSLIPEPHMGYMLAVGVALLLMRRQRPRDERFD